jgi:hypothetical protein
MKDTKSSQPALKAGFVILILAMLWLSGKQVGLAQNTFQVPEYHLQGAASATTIRRFVFDRRIKSVSRNPKVAQVPVSVQGDSPHTFTWWCVDLNEVWKVKVPVISWEMDLVPPDESPIPDPCTTAFPVAVPEGSSFALGNFLWYTNKTYEPAVRAALQEMGYSFHASSPAEDFMSKLTDIRVEVRTFPTNVLVAEHHFDPQRSFRLVRARDFFGQLLPLVGPIVNSELGIDLSLDEVGRLPMHGFPVIIPPAGAPGEYQVLVYLTMSDWHNDGLGMATGFLGNILPAGEFLYVQTPFTVVP